MEDEGERGVSHVSNFQIRTVGTGAIPYNRKHQLSFGHYGVFGALRSSTESLSKQLDILVCRSTGRRGLKAKDLRTQGNSASVHEYKSPGSTEGSGEPR